MRRAELALGKVEEPVRFAVVLGWWVCVRNGGRRERVNVLRIRTRVAGSVEPAVELVRGEEWVGGSTYWKAGMVVVGVGGLFVEWRAMDGRLLEGWGIWLERRRWGSFGTFVVFMLLVLVVSSTVEDLSSFRYLQSEVWQNRRLETACVYMFCWKLYS